VQPMKAPFGIHAVFLVGCLAGCVSTSPITDQTRISAKLGFDVIYSSTAQTVSRSMCPRGVIAKPAPLPPETLTRIANLAKNSGFFSLPTKLSEPSPREVIGVDGQRYLEHLSVSPCFTSSLEISYKGQEHRIEWSCTADVRGRSEIAALEAELAVYIAALPRTNCAYL
jgi:hypothetical protein